MQYTARTIFLIFALTIGLDSVAAELVIGQVGTFSSTLQMSKDLHIGGQILFESINARGGIHGAKLKLVTIDRSTDTKDAVEKTAQLIQRSQPLALLNLQGTGPMEALKRSRVLDGAGIPVVGIRTGAASLHDNAHSLLFHVRASYGDEIERIVNHMSTIGLHRVAVLYEDSPFGKEGFALVKNFMGKSPQMALLDSATYVQGSTDVSAAVRVIRNANPQALILIANTAAAAEFYRIWRSFGAAGTVYALSIVDSAEVVKRIGKARAAGLVVTQVVPNPHNRTMPLVRSMHDDFKRYAPPQSEVNQTVLEGYTAATVLVEALRLAGQNPTRQKVLRALDSMKEFDAGGFVISFAPNRHGGSKFVEMAIILRSGVLMR